MHKTRKKKRRPFVPPVFDVVPTYTGGRTAIHCGYVFELVPGHRLQNTWGFVAQHRLVAEDKLGRELQIGEHVHHIDGNRQNNSPKNLQVMSREDHLALHRPTLFLISKRVFDKEEVRSLLQKGGLKYAAKMLHCHTQTLRNRFPELVAPYKRRAPTKIDDPKIISTILRLAADPTVGYYEVSKMTGVAWMTVLRICRRNGVMWVKKSRRGEIHRTYCKRPTKRSQKERDDPSSAPVETPLAH